MLEYSMDIIINCAQYVCLYPRAGSRDLCLLPSSTLHPHFCHLCKSAISYCMISGNIRKYTPLNGFNTHTPTPPTIFAPLPHLKWLADKCCMIAASLKEGQFHIACE